MSILLDALKKSEQQRQLGATPSIYSDVDGRAADNGSMHRWAPVAMSALAAIVIAWIGWNQYQAPFNVLDAAGKPPDTTVIAANKKAEAEQETKTAAVAALEETETRPPGFNLPVRNFKALGEQSFTNAATTPGSVEPDQQERQRINQSFANYTAEQRAAQEGATQPETSAPDAEQHSDPRVGPDDRQAQVDRNRRMEPAEPEPVSYWSLPQGVRDNLPEFKISVLVYAEQPGDRFLLMNGKRWVEQEMEGGVRLDEIRRDGAVFLYQKYRFLVKG